MVTKKDKWDKKGKSILNAVIREGQKINCSLMMLSFERNFIEYFLKDNLEEFLDATCYSIVYKLNSIYEKGTQADKWFETTAIS